LSRGWLKLGVALAAAWCAAGVARAQGGGPEARPAPLATAYTEAGVDSGPLVPDTVRDGTLYMTEAAVLDARWLRLKLDETLLAEDAANPLGGAWLIITSLEDGAVQYLNAESLRQWGGSSAYFNGSIVRVELWSPAGIAPSRVRIAGVYSDAPDDNAFVGGGVGAFGPVGPLDLCGNDDRTPTLDNRMGRLVPAGCTAWMFNDTNRMFLSAGHCSFTGNPVVQFNVPPSTATGTWVNPPPEDQYAVDTTSVQNQNGGPGLDWSYFGVFPNSNTGLMPVQRYGSFFTLAPSVPAPAGGTQTARLTGFGSVSPPVSLTRNNTQQTDTGTLNGLANNILTYSIDTTGGNSGSPVVDEAGALGPPGSVLAVHTHQGCTVGGNQGTIVTQANLRWAINNPNGVTRSGRGTVAGSLYALGDVVNNFGTVSLAPNNFAKVATVGARWQGLAYDYVNARFLGINASREVHALDSAGNAVLLGTVGNVSATLTGLAYDPFQQRVFAMDPTVGQLYRLDPSTWNATPVGAPLGASLRALEFDVLRRTLWSLETGVGGGAVLVRINPDSGARTTIGPVGAGLGATGDLAASPSDGQLYAINPTNGDLIRINPNTAAGLDLGSTRGLFSTSHGLAFAQAPQAGFAPGFHGVFTIDDRIGNGNNNGRADPGERKVRVWLSLLSAGTSGGSGVVGRVESLSPTVSVGFDTAAWPDLPPGTEAYCDTPMVISVAPEHPCGEPINLSLTVTASEGEWTGTVSIPTGTTGGVGSAVTVSYTTPSVAIPADNQAGVVTQVNVTNLTSVADLDFRINGTTCVTTINSPGVGLAHSWVGDLVLRLTSPVGTTVDLMLRPGGVNNNGRNFCQTLLDDSATNSIQSISNTQAPFVGSFRPAGSLAAFNGQDPRGNWRLTVVDNVSSDTGFVRNWSLIIRPPAAAACSPPAAFDDTMDYNADGFINLDDLGDFISDFYLATPLPGPGGYAVNCPNTAPPYHQGYRVGYSSSGVGICSTPTLDVLGDFITDFYAPAP
jgi:subtilisin-like proprotein convertase family protein